MPKILNRSKKLRDAGFETISHHRLPDDNGRQYVLEKGGTVNIYDTGSVVPQGVSRKDKKAIKRALKEPMPDDESSDQP